MVCCELNAEMLYEMIDHHFSLEACERLMHYYDYEYVSFNQEDELGMHVIDPDVVKYMWKEYISPKTALTALVNSERIGLYVKEKLIESEGLFHSESEALEYLNKSGLTILTGCLNGHVLVMQV